MKDDGITSSNSEHLVAIRKYQGVWVALLLLLPRLVRMAYGETWIEDDAYLDLAYRISQGLSPYREVPIPHNCLLEYFLGFFYWLFGPSLRIAECLNNLAIWCSAVIVYRGLAKRGHEVWGILAGLLLSLSSLTFRYHLWERENFLLPIFALTIGLLLTRKSFSKKICLLFAILMIVSGMIKLTGLIFWIAVCLYLIAIRRDKQTFFHLVTLGGGGLLLIFGLMSVMLWPDFCQQVFSIHFSKGGTGGIVQKIGKFPGWLDLLFALGVPGFYFLWKNDRTLAKLLSIWTGCELVFYILISPTLWPHNLIHFLIPLSIASAASLQFLFSTPRLFRTEPGLLLKSGGLLLWLLVSMIWISPIQASYRHRGAIYGFGFQSREEIERVATVVQAYSEADSQIVSPALIAVASNRIKLIPYREIAGDLEAIHRQWHDRRTILRRARQFDRSIFSMIEGRSSFWTLQIAMSLKEGEISVVVNDLSATHYPDLIIPADYLRSCHYLRVARTEHYEIWARADSI